MMMTRKLALVAVPLFALSLGACKGEFTAAPPPTEDDEDSLVGAQNYDDEEMSDDEALDDKYGARAELPPLAEPKEKCTGKGSKRECKMVDPKPEVSAAHGVRKLTQGFRWGMDVDAVMAQLSKEIEAEYAKKQSETSDAVQQDANRAWRKDELDGLAQQHVVLEARAHHKWGVSAIAGGFVDDENEEMIWINGPTLKKFYFFKDGELWRIAYTYSNQHWPGMDYAKVLDEKLKKWFGMSPAEQQIIDEKSGAPTGKYHEWKSLDGDIVRAFNMRSVNGVILLSVVDEESEKRYGIRLPNPPKDEAMSEEVDSVLGGSDICYDEEGNMIEDAAKCKEIRGY